MAADPERPQIASTRQAPEPCPWGVDVALEAALTLPHFGAVDRAGLCEWAWHRWGDRGLTAIDEGAIDVDEAAALGLAASPRVIDAAAAPADRDWVGERQGGTITCWFESEPAARAAAGELAAVAGCRVVGVRPLALGGDDWRRGFAAIDVPGFGRILPAWESGAATTDGGDTTLFIEPGVGFGTGLHETTQLCLAAVAAWRREGGSLAHVIDMGAGSGILGIAAAVLGAARVEAVEIDPLVHDAIRANARRNGVAERVAVSRVLAADAGDATLIVANIVADVLMAEADAICGRLRRAAAGHAAGCLVLSGLLAAEVPAVAERYAAVLGTAPQHTHRGEWHCLRL